MKQKGTKRLLIITSLMVVVLISTLVFMQFQYQFQYNELREESGKHIYNEWYQIYRMSEMIDKYYINNNFEDGEKYALYLNQVCYHFYSSVNMCELNKTFNDLLIEAYDPIFKELNNDEKTIEREKVEKLFEEMNRSIMAMSKEIINSYKNEYEALLMTDSQKYIQINEKVKDLSETYLQDVDDYFREK